MHSDSCALSLAACTARTAEITAEEAAVTDEHAVQTCGFSGTNDNRIVLPFSVQPVHFEKSTSLETDGKMVHTLLVPGKCTFQYLDAPPPMALLPQSKLNSAAEAEVDATVLVTVQRGERGNESAASGGGDTAAQRSKGSRHGWDLLHRVVALGVDALIDAGAAFPSPLPPLGLSLIHI